MRVIARPLEWLLCYPPRAANDARVDAENDRIDGIVARRIAEGDRRRQAIEREYAGVLDDQRLGAEYYQRLRTEHNRYMDERNEERHWRSKAHLAWFEESRRINRKADRNLFCFIWAVAFATWIEVTALALWA